MSKTPLEEGIVAIRRDQNAVGQILRQFDFDLAAKIVALYVEQKALAEQLDPATAWKPSADEMRNAAGKMVLDALKAGRDNGEAELHGTFMVVRYRYPGYSEILEEVHVDLSTITSMALVPHAKYMRDTQAYLEAMGGGWIDEDGRWQPDKPPSANVVAD